MQLSQKAINELRIALRNSYGEDFERELSDLQVNKLGDLLLTVLAEGLKIMIINPEMFTKGSVNISESEIRF